jgi:chloramphenicol 3-O phosphotransferase
MAQSRGRIILLNGTSSAGKSTLAKVLRVRLAPQFHYYSSDQLADAGFRPLDGNVRFKYRESFFEGFHRSISAFAEVGLDLLVEHIVECQSWADDLKVLLSPFDVFWVGVHAPVAEIERRERLRGNRQIGEGVYHLKTHTFCEYDLEVDTTQPLEQNVETILTAWRSRSISAPDQGGCAKEGF